MKKPFTITLSLFLALLLAGCALDGVSLLYSEDGVIDGFYISVSSCCECKL